MLLKCLFSQSISHYLSYWDFDLGFTYTFYILQRLKEYFEECRRSTLVIELRV
jgi:hypothetical protein